MINNINTYSNLFNASSTSTSEVDAVIAEHKQSTAVVEQEISHSTNLYLSSRAQKINSISQEFFSGGSLSVENIDSLKERVYQLGLISKQEYASLTNTELSEKELAAAEALPNQNIANFIGDFLTRLDETDAGKIEKSEIDEPLEESETLILLKSTLLTAKDILSDVEQAKTNSNFKESLASTLSFLQETISADAFEKMPLDDKVGLSKTYQALEIVDKISPQRLSNDKLNRYLEVSLE
ncbi:hypothetical protein [Thalassotalea profundi]|uniref:Uncharacterized protein n=1 Tax=Thalassotalea profundi TaxID=2036687 RepID=A0ABQ3IKD1_9GAMM|nr:hypothetical protein [Thalassotalea profundi]GHE86448.1 hypothetical protein GCM10011501_14540 [Thalassotalea profundi]